MKFIDRSGKIIDYITNTVAFITWIIFFVIMCLTIGGLVLRFLGKPLSGIVNLLEFFLVIGIYCGIAYTQKVKQHVFVELLLLRMPNKIRQKLNILNLIISLGVCVLLTFESWNLALHSWQVREKIDGPPYYPIYPVKTFIAAGVSALTLQLIKDLFEEIMLLSERNNAK